MMMVFNIKQFQTELKVISLKLSGVSDFFQPSSFNSFSQWDNLFDLCENTTTSQYISPTGLLVLLSLQLEKIE